MIHCPLCNHLVRNETDTNYLDDNALEDFYCETRAIVYKMPWCHYMRATYQGLSPQYSAIIPPFHIKWYEGTNCAEVRLMGYNGEFTNTIVYKEYNVDKKKILNIYERFSKLKAWV